MISIERMFILFISFFIFYLALGSSSYSERVRLEDVQALTLHANRMTTGRRTSPVPQLKCVKGSQFPQPKLVQCVNKGWDGSSVQWECKAQLDSRFQLGGIEVVCEGYDYADDPYILKGSCGLEYTIETKPGQEGYSGNSYGWKSHIYGSQEETSSSFGNILFIVGCCIVIYGLYRTCLAPNMQDPYTQSSTTDEDRPDDGLGPNAPRNMGWNIPGTGTGFGGQGTEYMPRFDSCGAGRRRRSYWRNMGGAAGPQGGGFWTGLATGGMLGYMFGGNNRSGYNSAPRHRSNYGGSSGLFSSEQPSASVSSSESTSFGGTRRR